MIDWSRGYSARYYMTIVDKSTWRDVMTIDILGGSIRRTDSDLMESADVNCINYSEADVNKQLTKKGRPTVSEQYIRIWLDARQGADSSHTPLFTGLASSPTRTINGRRVETALQCYSVLKPAQDVLLPPGWYAPAATDGYAIVRELLKVTGAPVIFEGATVALKNAIIAEQNESNLSMVYKILAAMTDPKPRRIKIDGDGTIRVLPYNFEPVKTFDSVSYDILEKQITVDRDWYECPNVFRAIVDNTTAIARDTDPDSPFSIQNRGREIWAEETNCNLSENESLQDYAERRLKDLQKVNTQASYDRRFDPDVYITDVVKINYPSVNLTGKYLITDQTIDLGYGAKTSEEAVLYEL